VSIKDRSIRYFLRSRIVHRLPGRLRIHLPLLKRLPRENSGAVAIVARLLSLPDGISEVAPCLETGNVVIRYNAALHTDDDVLRYLHALTQLCVTNRDLLESLSAEHLFECEERLCTWLKEKLAYRLELDGSMRIPDDVLA